MTKTPRDALDQALLARFPDAPTMPEGVACTETLRGLATRGSCRAFNNDPVPFELLDMLSALALASPTKSDLQQRDIIFVQSASVRTALADLVSGQAWVAQAPIIAVFCGNNRRQRLIHEWHDVPFANDHLDAFFNASVDAAIALSAFVVAAESQGLGCCPISAVRNAAAKVSTLLHLPDHVFPVAGLAIGYPAQAPDISMRLPLRVTRHVDRYSETGLREAVAAYDESRAARQPYNTQRRRDVFGAKATYTWSDDKTRQYSAPERADFGAFVRAKGFRLD
ncbi:nitroreductase family protein [Primorskyibacter sp. S187A]|uniref:nitroreductase family protein n=1 Tax=Primorskyibacter sp. S187A TaxID=3415130 RepID=UPI003C7C945F